MKKSVRIFFILLFFVLIYVVLAYKIYYTFNERADLFSWLYGLLTGTFLFSRFVVSFYYSDNHEKTFEAPDYPAISFIIACKNEEGSVAKTINTCLYSQYPGPTECIAVDDGSDDMTLAHMFYCKQKWGEKLKIISFEKNRGKREAMAEGVIAASHEIIIFVDSDSFLKPNAARLIVEHLMTDQRVGAVSGNTLVENVDTNMLTRMQSARYGISFDIFKAAESVFGVVICCPGCFSAYRKSAILEVLDRWRNQMFLGTRSTFGDDRSLTNFVLRTWKVVYCRRAIATTIVPETYIKFFKQQLRWKKSWIREGFINAGSFMWKKNPLASLPFYANLVIPVVAPIVAFRILFLNTIFAINPPFFYLLGLVAMGALFGIYYYFISLNKYWWYVLPFQLIYTFLLIWQMPYAFIKLKDTKWGTR